MSRSQAIAHIMEQNNVSYAYASYYYDVVIEGVK